MSSTIKHAFQCSLGYSRFTLSKGKDVHFLNGEYLTDIQSEIDELNTEVANGHPHITVNPDRVTVDTKFVDPLEAIKAKAIADYLANQAASLDKTNDRGDYDASKLTGIGNSTTVSEGMAGSNSGDGAGVANIAAPNTGASIMPAAMNKATIVPGAIAK